MRLIGFTSSPLNPWLHGKTLYKFGEPSGWLLAQLAPQLFCKPDGIRPARKDSDIFAHVAKIEFADDTGLLALEQEAALADQHIFAHRTIFAFSAFEAV